MKCTNRILTLNLIILMCSLFLFGCGDKNYDFPYDSNYGVSSFQVVNQIDSFKAKPFAADICIVSEDILDEDVDMTEATASCLFDVNKNQVLYSKNAHERLYPASLTKIMTALVAMKNGSMDQLLTATNTINITESGAQTCGLKPGDTMTLDQALHILLIYSANDVAMLIAENIGGSVEGFVEMMNQEAIAIGATNTSFTNPHGLSDDSHYTTAYDLYLIFNEALKYEDFSSIIRMINYETVYSDSEGNSKDLSVQTTNLYLRGDYTPPENITVLGGKTGTTNAAGHCLIVLSRDISGNSYISVILRSSARDMIYPEMSDLLEEINK